MPTMTGGSMRMFRLTTTELWFRGNPPESAPVTMTAAEANTLMRGQKLRRFPNRSTRRRCQEVVCALSDSSKLR